MKDFEYLNPAKIIFGAEPYKKVESALVSRSVKSILLIYSGEYIKDLGIYQEIETICNNNNIKLTANGSVVPNPKVELVRELIEQARENKVDFIIAVGGGSSVDTAKAVSIGVSYNGDVWDFFEGKATVGEVLPIGVITTIPASGSKTFNS